MVIIKKYKWKKNYLTNFLKDWNKFSAGKFPNSQPNTHENNVCGGWQLKTLPLQQRTNNMAYSDNQYLTASHQHWTQIVRHGL